MTHMAFHSTATRLWKHLPPEERHLAAAAFFREPPPDLAGAAIEALVKARHLRPQAARALPPDAQARILASVHEPGEPLAQGLLVALHLGERRGLLTAFLDALGLPHENGAPLAEDQVVTARRALASFPPEQVETYFNTLWLQDPARWAALASLEKT
jgi:hypothetical protein